jgi:hypothetical protein
LINLTANSLYVYPAQTPPPCNIHPIHRLRQRPAPPNSTQLIARTFPPIPAKTATLKTPRKALFFKAFPHVFPIFTGHRTPEQIPSSSAIILAINPYLKPSFWPPSNIRPDKCAGPEAGRILLSAHARPTCPLQHSSFVIHRFPSRPLKKCATGFASAENLTISQHWQSQWHAKFSKSNFFNGLLRVCACLISR